MLPSDHPLKPAENRPKIGYFNANQTAESDFVASEVSFGDTKKTVHLFPCSKIHEQSWFIAHGFHEDIHYLFVQQRDSEPISFEGLIEPSSERDRSLLHDVNYLEKSFINTMAHQSRWLPWARATEKDGGLLCTLNRNQLFRLCSSVYDAMKDDYFLPSVSIKYDEHYSSRPSSRTCVLDQVIEVEELRKSPLKYSVTSIRANLVMFWFGRLNLAIFI